jgi:hypothetical protein
LGEFYGLAEDDFGVGKMQKRLVRAVVKARGKAVPFRRIAYLAAVKSAQFLYGDDKNPVHNQYLSVFGSMS